MPDGAQRRGRLPFVIAPEVPPAAAEAIAWYAALPGMKAKDLALLERLATADVMRTNWPKLAAVDGGEIVTAILVAETEARDLRPASPQTTKDRAVSRRQTRPVPHSFLGVALFLEAAMHDMRELELHARAGWPHWWRGDPDMSFDRLLGQLNAAWEFYLRLHAENKRVAAEADLLPPPRKRGSKNARQIHFGRMLSDHFRRVGGAPLDEVVGAITGVVFDDASGGPSAMSVRGRRRSAGRRKADQS